MNILKGIEKWKNVAYRIEWFADGNLTHSDEICGKIPEGDENAIPCPNGDLHSTLNSKGYQIGQLVRFKISYFLEALLTFVTFMIRDSLGESTA